MSLGFGARTIWFQELPLVCVHWCIPGVRLGGAAQRAGGTRDDVPGSSPSRHGRGTCARSPVRASACPIASSEANHRALASGPDDLDPRCLTKLADDPGLGAMVLLVLGALHRGSRPALPLPLCRAAGCGRDRFHRMPTAGGPERLDITPAKGKGRTFRRRRDRRSHGITVVSLRSPLQLAVGPATIIRIEHVTTHACQSAARGVRDWRPVKTSRPSPERFRRAYKEAARYPFRAPCADAVATKLVLYGGAPRKSD